MKDAIIEYFDYSGINAASNGYSLKKYEVEDMSGTDAVYEQLVSCTYGPNKAISLIATANNGKIEHVFTFMPLVGSAFDGETLATIATMVMIPAGLFDDKYSTYDQLYNFIENLIQTGTRNAEGNSMTLVINDIKYTLTVSDVQSSFDIESN